MNTIVTKIEEAQKLIKLAATSHRRIAVACSFSSIVLPHLARSVVPDISIFAVMTPFMPQQTFDYLIRMNCMYDFKTKVYMVKEKIPFLSNYLQRENIEVILLPNKNFEKKAELSRIRHGKEIQKINPAECCRLLKVVPTNLAVRHLDAWISGLRITQRHKEIQKRGDLTEYNPLLRWKEIDVWKYMAINRIPVHPLMAMGYRSLGCDPCSHIIDDSLPERAGRWSGTNKCGGECGIHTQRLR